MPALSTRTSTWPQVASTCGEGGVDRGRVGDVELHGQRLPAGASMAAHGLGRAGLVGPVADGHPVAGGGQGHGDGPADAPGRAGDQGHPPAHQPACARSHGWPHRIRAVAQDMPAPNAGQQHEVAVVQAALVGRLGQAIGTDAAEVLP